MAGPCTADTPPSWGGSHRLKARYAKPAT